MTKPDAVVVGAGIVGLATAYRLLTVRPELSMMVIEKEDRPGRHQSGRNSGVIHSGIYYRPHTLKARLVILGREALLDFCRTYEIEHDICGKVILAAEEAERPRLEELRRRGEQSGVHAELIGPERLKELEPHASGVAALHVPEAGVVDFGQVVTVLARLVESAGGEVRFGCRVIGLVEDRGTVRIATDRGELETRVLVNCAGLHSDELAATDRAADPSPVRIVPFRGEYRALAPQKSHLVNTLIYPVPDPRFPFLGVHLSRTMSGGVLAGPNAVLALAREGYSWGVVDWQDLLDLLRFPGFRRLAANHWRTGVAELRRSLSTKAFARDLQRLVPEVQETDLLPAPSGVRAQAVDRDGRLVDDFVISASSSVINVFNAPSPAATASLEIGRWIADRVLARLDDR